MRCEGRHHSRFHHFVAVVSEHDDDEARNARPLLKPRRAHSNQSETTALPSRSRRVATKRTRNRKCIYIDGNSFYDDDDDDVSPPQVQEFEPFCFMITGGRTSCLPSILRGARQIYDSSREALSETHFRRVFGRDL